MSPPDCTEKFMIWATARLTLLSFSATVGSAMLPRIVSIPLLILLYGSSQALHNSIHGFARVISSRISSFMANKRSPLKGRPLRNPGQSLDEQIQDLVYDYMLWPMVFAVTMMLFALMEWARELWPRTPSPKLQSVVALSAVAFAAYRIYKALPRLRALKLGRDGEKAVGQFLERLRERGYHVFHDVIGGNFNLDHVVIGPAGVFTVETKTHTKPREDARIVFDGEAIRIGGFEPDRDPVIQAKAQGSWLRELLAESTGRKFEVRSVIVYPGWFVDYTGPKERTIWVLNPKALPSFLDHEPTKLSQEDIKLASFHLSRFVRTEENNTNS